MQILMVLIFIICISLQVTIQFDLAIFIHV